MAPDTAPNGDQDRVTDTAAWSTFAPVHLPKPKFHPGHCAAWNERRDFWCTQPSGHRGQHISINQGQVLDRWGGALS